MNYLSYLKERFPNYEVTEEVNYEWDGETPAMVIKYLTGTNYRDSTVQPIQLSIHTKDVKGTRNELSVFTATYNNAPFVQNFEYVQQLYSTPMLLTAFDTIGSNYAHQFVITATLIISTNVNNIKIVSIDGTEYETTQRILNYVGLPDTQRVSGRHVQESDLVGSIMRFNCTLINKNGEIFEKIRRLRKGDLKTNAIFNVKLTFTDNDTVEEYSMKLESSSLNSENQSLPILSLSFIK